MTSQLVDAHSRERIKTELERNLLVEAGAGSGKTQMMAERMAAGIAAGTYIVQHMAAVTFTRKAAAELRGRFQQALEAEANNAAKNAVDPKRVDRVRAALSDIERFFAGTIHSFCARLLRERPVESGVSPGFTELDEVEDTRLRRQSWRDYRSQLKSAADPLMLEVLDVGVKPNELDEAFERVCLFEEVEFPGGDVAVPEATVAWAGLDKFWKALQKLLPEAIPVATTCPTQQHARTFRKQLRVEEARRGDARALVRLLETWDFTPKVTQYQWSDDPAKKKKIAGEVTTLHQQFLTDVVEPFLQKWRHYVYRLSVELLTRARGYAATERRRLNTLNYGDLLHLSARVLREDPDVRRALADKYRWIFVDEFQDTDPVQADIMLALAAEDAGQLRPGSLFVVGDPKQSIFRFRRADIDIYHEVRERLEKSPRGEVLTLTSNFRSVPVLCEWANDVFSNQFPAKPTSHSPAFARLEAARADAKAASGIFTLTIPDTVATRDIPAHESAAIARFIQAEVVAKRRTYGDFLVLTRKRKDLKIYAAALEDQQIPVEVSGAGAFGDSPEVRQLALLLRALADPQDGLSLVGVLRGSLFGLSDRDLFAYKQGGGWFSIFAELPATKSKAAKRVAAAIAELRQIHRWTQVLPAAAAVERMLERTGYLALAATTPGGVEAGDLLHAVDQVRAIVERGATLADAADALGPDAPQASDVESLPLEPGRDDVVRVMNVHKAKGLEAPVVFLADPRSGVRERADARIEREGASARGYFVITRKVGEYSEVTVAEPADWAAHEAEELQYVAAEEQRLLYVAATRAKDALVVSRWAGAGGRGGHPWAAFEPFLMKAKELKVPAAINPQKGEAVDLSAAAAADAAASAAALHAQAARASCSAVSVTSESKRFLAPSAVAAAADDPTRMVTEDTPSRRADTGVAWGTLIHGLLEFAMRRKTTTREDLRRLAMWLTVEQQELRVVTEKALDTVETVAQAEFWKEARASAEVHEEVPFGVREDRRGRPTIVSGAIDLVYRRAADWRIEDYKTDADVDTNELRKRYSEQIEAYRKAWEKFTSAPVSADVRPAR